MLILIVGHLLAICIGLSLGLIGGGGSILAVPVLVYIMGIGTKEAIAMSLAIVGSVSLLGMLPHWRRGNVNFKTFAIFTPTAMIGAYFGARLASFPGITDTIQMMTFGAIALLASILMISRSNHVPKAVDPSVAKDNSRWWLIPLGGLGVGLITGFVGVGGGFAIVPVLVLLGGIPIKEAIGTSLLIITFNSIAGIIGYLGQVPINWSLTFSMTIAASLGTLGGAYLNQFIDGKRLQKFFGFFVLGIATVVLLQH
ncbi:MAG: sulfite exporter TauE/SafE family protein [Arthrospira sp. SH-MAG29]|nr:sulfite exporter TauE/SafE family protein [Arthrospira sp. SH-MAG29]MBS0015414.1 sulfite exporter TauE/SafE family protein [Arthrospira sp. SH-MAG29]